MTRTRNLTMLACIVTGALSLSACGGSSAPTDSTVAAAPDSAAPVEAGDTTVAAPASDVPATDAPAVTDSPAVTDAPTTDAPSTDAPTTEPSAAATTVAAGGVTVEAAIAAQLTAMGDPDAAATAACIQKANPDLTPESLAAAGGASASFIRGLIKCAPDFMAAQAVTGVKTTKLNDDQKKCVVKQSLLVIVEQDDATFEKLMAAGNSGLPDDLKKDIAKKAAAECDVDEAIALEVMNEG